MARQSNDTALVAVVNDIKDDIKDMKDDIASITEWMNIEKGRREGASVRNSSGNINWSPIVTNFLIFSTVSASIILTVLQILQERTTK